jgi:hypothetical protein
MLRRAQHDKTALVAQADDDQVAGYFRSCAETLISVGRRRF